jgi:hypothetical protein
MFYARINKIKIFDNREGFFGLFNRAELQIYSLVSNPTNMSGAGHFGDFSGQPKVLPQPILLKMDDLLCLSDKKRKEKLLEAALTEAERFSQSYSLEIDGVKDNQSLLFGESGLVVYQSNMIPDLLDIQLWVIESDRDVRKFSVDADTVLESEAFKKLLSALKVASDATDPILSGIISIGGVVTQLLRKKLIAGKDDLAGYWQAFLNREEHYPHGIRDRQDVWDTTGNILIDYTLFGFENGEIGNYKNNVFNTN